MVHLVNFELCLCDVAFATQVTLEWPFYCVLGLLVFLEKSRVLEGLLTRLTCVLLLSCVSVHVTLQVCVAFKALVTKVTLVSFLCHMRKFMTLQTLSPSKGLLT